MSDPDADHVHRAATIAADELASSVRVCRHTAALQGLDQGSAMTGLAIALADMLGAIVAHGSGTDAEVDEACERVVERVRESLQAHRRRDR